MDEEYHVAKNMSALCTCWSCQYLSHWTTSLQPYRCNYKACLIEFESFTDMYEHQLEVHGVLNPKTHRVVNDTFHQQQGTLAFPPATVYAAQQYLVPSRPPIAWKAIAEVDEEAKVVRDKLRKYNPNCFDTPYKLFKTGYQLVKRNGWEEMQRQYQIAMEHFYSGMKFLASSRSFHDGCPSIERGRNWLTSTDREDTRSLFPFGVNDKADAEPEFLLIDTERDREMQERCIVLSDDSDDDSVIVNGITESTKKMSRMKGDAKSKLSAYGKSKSSRKQNVSDTASDEHDADVNAFDGDKGNQFNERDVLIDESDNDSAIIKSEKDGSNSDSETDSNSESAFLKGSDSSSNGEEAYGEERPVKASDKFYDEVASVSNSASTSEDEARLDIENDSDGSVSESSSNSDSHSGGHDKKIYTKELTASETSSSDNKLKLKDDFSQYDSDTESESEDVNTK